MKRINSLFQRETAFNYQNSLERQISRLNYLQTVSRSQIEYLRSANL